MPSMSLPSSPDSPRRVLTIFARSSVSFAARRTSGSLNGATRVLSTRSIAEADCRVGLGVTRSEALLSVAREAESRP